MTSPYKQDFYKSRQHGSLQSARIIIPLLLELIAPKSVVDVGCGVGTWLSVFKEYDIKDILGIDGEWVDKKMLMISEEQFVSHNLEEPIEIDKEFDLVMSLEVAEHIPPEKASIFIDSLTRLGPVIFFSAAIPFQIGKHHVNEQWPEYWVRHFEKHEYSVIDPIRKKIWQNDDVEYWYAQNLLVFARRDYIEAHPSLEREMENTFMSQLSLVHPKMYQLNSAPIRILLSIPILNTIFLNIITDKTVRNLILERFLRK
jgi:SAM-dependent methyltransferase